MSKSLPGTKALDDIKLTVKPRSIHALTGENGVSKSILMKCPFGLYRPDSGTVEIDGRVVGIKDPSNALKNGTSMIRQEPNPVPYRNIVDNIRAGRFRTRGIVVDENQMTEETRNLFRDPDFDVDVTTSTKNPSILQMQAVKIIKAVSYNAKVIVMSEPTSLLTVAETWHFSEIAGELRKEGRSIIYISHKLEEAFEIAGKVTVTRDSQYIGTWDIKDIIIDQLIDRMVGGKINGRFPLCEDARTDEVMLQVKDFTSTDPRSFKNASFGLHKGEILDIGELMGAQKTGLIEAMFDLRKAVSGELTINGKVMINHSLQDAMRNGFTLLIEERRVTGIIPMLSVWDSALTAAYRKPAGNVFGYIHTKKLFPSVDKMCIDLNIRMVGTKTLVKNLSGRNQQKMLIGRWPLANCDVIMLGESIRGMNVDAKYRIYQTIQGLVKKGKAIVMIFSETSELLGMSDHIMIMCVGKQTGILDKTEATQVEVMECATQFKDRTKEGMPVRK